MILSNININHDVSNFVVLSLVILLVGFLLRILKQPSIITYMVVGILAGPYGLKLITNEVLISNLGDLGLILLLFFVGMEIHLPNLIANWRVSVIGTFLQVVISMAVVGLVGNYYGWTLDQIIMLGFVISLSSTAVIIKLLEGRNELNTQAGQNVLGILLAQDILIVPMLIILGYLGGNRPSTLDLLKQISGGILIVGVVIYILKKKHIKLPFQAYIRNDHETQVFVALSMCFGFSFLTAWLGLSVALGAFIAGIIVSSARATTWVYDSLHAFKILFVALFFVSIGMLIDLRFLRANLPIVLILVAINFVLNNLINSVTLRVFCKNWRISLYGGALLSQIGEFSFILGAVGHSLGIISNFTYQLILNTIVLSLLFSPVWVSLIRRLTKIGSTT